MRRKLRHLRKRWIDPILPLKRLRRSVPQYLRYFADWSRYAAMPGAEPLRFEDSYPRLFDGTPTTPYDAHYFYQDIWALKRIYASGAPSHVDVGSRAIFVGMLTAFTDVTFVDIRPLVVDLDRFDARAGSILDMPFEPESVESLSCLHVAEHIGLGRYGDPLDPGGTKKAAKELARVLAPAGDLYFSVPVGRPRVCFNAHRVHTPQQILDYFGGLRLVHFSGVEDDGTFKEELQPEELSDSRYACGLFHFRKS